VPLGEDGRIPPFRDSCVDDEEGGEVGAEEGMSISINKPMEVV
jgi:hypothetical protein